MTETPRQFAERVFNSIGICGDANTVGRLIGYYEDDEDCYYRIRVMNGVRSSEHKEILWSACGWFIPLKGVVADAAYSFLESVHCLNGCPPAETFSEEVSND